MTEHEHNHKQHETVEQAQVEKAPIHANVNVNENVTSREVKFHFKKNELGDRRPTVELTIPVLSYAGVINVLEKGSPKEIDMLLEAVAEVVVSQARSFVNDQEDISQENFPFDKLTWEFIANMPKAERRGGGISKEIWEEFGKDYATVMPGVTGKTAEHVGNAVKLYLTKFTSIKSNKPVLNKLKDQLGIYIEHTQNGEDFAQCVEFLLNKVEVLLKADDSSLLENL